MGLDIYLYQFRNVDTDAILKLWEFSEEPWAFEGFKRWSALPESERGIFPSEKEKAEGREKLMAKARELGLPERVAAEQSFGGVNISFPSKLHPRWMVGDWYSLSTTRAIMQEFTSKDLYYVFPEAKTGSRLFKPNWSQAKERLTEILKVLRRASPEQLERFIAGLSDSFADYHLSQIEVMIETMDFVLNSDNPNEFFLLWSD